MSTQPDRHNDHETVEHLPALTNDTSTATAMARIEIDMRVATARQYPRSIKRAVENIITLATLDDVTAAECIYALPRGKKPIRGPSIRLAEIIHQCWGNCDVVTKVTSIDKVNKIIVSEGTFTDLETNSGTRTGIQRRIVDKYGRLFSDDMIVVTGNAASSIARRNAILAGVPKAIWRRAYEECEKVVAGTVVTIVQNRESAIKAFAVYGVKPEQVFAALEVEGDEDVGLQEIITLRGMFSAIKNGEATVEEMFPAAAAKKQNGGDADFNPLVESSDGAGSQQDTAVQPGAGDSSASSQPRSDEEQAAAKGAPPGASGAAPGSSQSDARPLHPNPPAKGDRVQGDGAQVGGPPADQRPDLFLAFSQACSRANQAGSLKAVVDQFWGKNTAPAENDKAACDKIDAIYAVHVKRIKGELTPKDADAELKALLG